jgi:methylase of polypeptide subunit release factors
LAEPPTLFATAGEGDGFHVIYGRLNDNRLLIGPQRPVVTRLLQEHPYALFLFSDRSQTHWHFVNVRYEKDGDVRARRVFRRITVGPYERLRTATERISMLDIASLSPDLFGISPLVIQGRHDEAFDVEAVTKDFFRAYRTIFERAEAQITGIEGETRRLFTQRLFNRLLFLVFLERKGWLTFDGEHEYIQALWKAHQQEKSKDASANFFRDRLKLLFFSGLNTPHEVNVVGIRSDGFLQVRIGQVPYLNGGLFEEDELDRDPDVHVPDEAVAPAMRDLLYHYNFTVTESTPLDIEVAVDPEMLGKIFEELVTGRHETGSYYTPKPVVAFMGQEALKGYLKMACPGEKEQAIAAFVEERDATGLKNPERVLGALRTVKICDLACGSGAYLLGMLHELLALRSALFAARQLDPLTAYQRKLEIIQHNLYGVDIDPFAINIARLRLWLSLIVDFEGDNPPPLPNLDFKIEVGDSLPAPDPSGGLGTGFRKELVDRFFRLKADYLVAHGGEKLSLREQIESLRAEIAAWAGRSESTIGFDWAVEFAEVFAGPGLAAATLGGAMAGVVNVVPGQMELVVANGKGSGFDIVLANPPYVRADAQYRHILDEDERQAAIAHWQQYRRDLKRSKIYDTLYEKWDLYIPFLERAYQLLRPGGQMVFIISDAYNTAKYTRKSHEFFLQHSCIARLDFCSDIPLFEAAVSNTILHFVRAEPGSEHTPLRFRRWGESPEDFEDNVESLSLVPQLDFGPALFRPGGKHLIRMNGAFTPLEKICYISVGMVIHADERKAHLAFKAEDLISSTKDRKHTKPYVEGKDLAKWWVQRVRFLEYGTSRAPALFRRPTFPQLYEVPEKLISMDLSGDEPRVTYDASQLYHNHSAWSFVLWHHLKDVVNQSVNKKAKYHWQSPDGDREERERISREFHPKYLLAIMNSAFARDWLAPRRRSKRRFYPDDWKQLPIATIPLNEQEEFVRLVDAILAEFEQCGYPLAPDAAKHVVELEWEIDERVARLYGYARALT